MKYTGNFTILFILVIFLFISCACSRSPIDPAIPDTFGISSNLPESIGSNTENRHVIAVYDAVIDPFNKTFSIEPSVRDAQYHFPLTQLYPGTLQIVDYGWNPNFVADIRLTHPLPGSEYAGYDPRVIAILPANPGVRFYYPALGIGGNNSVVKEPDGYTKLFDELGGSIIGNVNPFKAYFKNQPNRVWMSTGAFKETQRWNMNLTGFGGPLRYKLVVDVSSNFPNPPQPVFDNASEPVQIEATVKPGLTPSGGSAEINVTVLDWQGVDGTQVRVEAPDLFNGTVALQFSAIGPNANEYIYTGTIANSLHAPFGVYKFCVDAFDEQTGIHAFKEFKAKVSGGLFVWVKSSRGANYEYGLGITTLSDNSSVATGNFYGSVTFGRGEPNETPMDSFGSNDIFIARYNADGSLAWAKQAGGISGDRGNHITSLPDDSVTVTGYFSNSATFGPGEPNQTILTSAGGSDIFIARYNPNGTLAWAKQAGGSVSNKGCGVAKLNDNSISITGYFGGSATFGPGEVNETILTAAGSFDIFIAKYNFNGTLIWAKQAGGPDEDSGYGITSLSDSSIMVTGSFESMSTFGPNEMNEKVLWSDGDNDIFIAKYHTDGLLAWVKRAGGSSYDQGQGISRLSDNSTVVTGYFDGSATFGPDESNESILTSAGMQDIFIARYNPNGSLAWVKRIGGIETDIGYGITTLSYNTVVVTGAFSKTVTFGPGEMNETILASPGNRDIFIARYYPDGSLAWAKRAGGTDEEWGCGIAKLSNDYTTITGYFYGSGSPTFGPGEANEKTIASSGYADFFIAQYEP